MMVKSRDGKTPHRLTWYAVAGSIVVILAAAFLKLRYQVGIPWGFGKVIVILALPVFFCSLLIGRRRL